ncbi:MAG TPA: NAD-dependent epimerase/dehydratase family protein [Bacteroidota bacterium]|nr:NAD-dependent epimerase/dehydratase family protein [Bacteroidota bacterium]
MAKSLITGGAGFIGSHVAAERLKKGDSVVVLDDLSGGFTENIPEGARFIKGSITDAPLVEELFRKERFDFVFHLGAYAAEGLSHFIRRFNYTNNTIGSINLINASVRNGAKCFVFTSSIAVYGTGQVPMTEDMIPSPEDPYGISKFSVELDLKAAKHMFGLEYIIFRPHNVYGEHQNIADRYRNVIGIFMNQLMQGKPLTIFGDGSQTRAFSYVAEVAPIIAESVDVPRAAGEIFNIGADTPYSVNYLADVVATAMNKKAEITYLPARQEVLHAFSSHDKLRKVFGERRPVTLENGIERMAKWALSIGPRKTIEFKDIELENNLPSAWVKR